MPAGEFWNHREPPAPAARTPPRAGRWVAALGLFSLLVGFAAMAGGAYLGIIVSTRLVPLPAGLPAAPSETLGIILASCGAITLLLGVLSLHKAHDG